MPVFGGVRSLVVRDHMEWDEATRRVRDELAKGRPEELERLSWQIGLPLPVVLDAVGRLRRSGMVKQLAGGRWILQNGVPDAGKGVRNESRRRKRAA